MSELVMSGGRVALMVALALAGWAAYRWWRRHLESSGTLEIDLPNTPFQPNGTAQGLIRLRAGTRDLGPGRVVVSLVCKYVWQERERRNDEPDRIIDKERILYRQDVDVATDYSLHADNSQTFEFALAIPAADIDITPESRVGRFAKAVGDIGKKNEQQFWSVEGRYHVRGLDVTASRRISIQFQPPAPPPPSSTAQPFAPPPQPPPPGTR